MKTKVDYQKVFDSITRITNSFGLAAQGKNPLRLDSKEPSLPVADYAFGEIRYRTLKQINSERAEMLIAQAQDHANARYNYYKQLAAMDWSWNGGREASE